MNTSLQENQFRIPDGHNCLVISLKGQTWLSVFLMNQRLFTSKSSNSVLKKILSPGEYIVRTDGEILNITSVMVERMSSLLKQVQESTFLLRLTSDAPDQHIIDGIGEIPADGTSFCNLNLTKLSFNGTPLTSNKHSDELFIRTTGGLIMDATGENHIRSLRLQSGQAQFRLISEPNPKLVTVSVFGRQPQTSKAEIQIEFV